MVPTVLVAQDVDFRKDILPIFEKHCFECHGDGNLEGDLSLESVASMQIGGHSGSPILSSELSDSELYLRITSLSDGYRMPKKGDPLPQQDVDKIAKWMHQIAGSFESRSVAATVGNPSNQDEDNLASISKKDVAAGKSVEPVSRSFVPSSTYAPFDSVSQSQGITLVVTTAVICLLFCWLFYRITAGRPGGRRITSNTERASAYWSMVIGAFSGLILIGIGFLYWRCGVLAKENASLRSRVELLKPKMAPLVEVGPGSLPMPPHPLHPPRLGGQYYRGNDERDDSLYNNGFYRTATIGLHLVDAEGKRLQWGDKVGDDLSVEIVIERAPKATRELFSARVLSQTSLEHYSQSSPGVQQKLKFEVVEEEDEWSVQIPLPPRTVGATQESKGMIYLMYGMQPGEKSLPRPHFAVRYDLRITDSKIATDSVLWMGSMYTLNNRVLVPDEKEILLDRWFDWRPIPVIEGEGATDASLLGTDEHLDK